MELKAINRNIGLVAKAGTKFNELVQTTAVGILVHAQATGDCTAALRLVQAMPKSARRGLLINFFAAYSPIGMNVGTGKVAFHKPTAKSYKPFDIEGATNNPWYNSAEANNEDLPDTTLEQTNKMIFGLASRLQKQLDEGHVAANDRETVAEQVAQLKALGRTVAKVAAPAGPVAIAA